MSHVLGGPSVAVPARRRRNAGRAHRTKKTTYFLLGAATLVSVFPLYWMFVVASNGTEAMSQVPPAVVPGGRFFENTEKVFDNVQFLPALLNSFIVAGSVAVSVVFFSTLAGFAFAKLRFRGRGALFIIVITTMMVPVQLGIIPLYMVMVRLGWTNQLQAVIVPMMVTAFGVFWMRQYILGSLPTDLLDAGRVDGCSTFGLFRHIVIPSVRPAAAVLGLFTFMQAWNEFFWPLVVLRDPSKFTVQIALQQLNNAYYQDYGMVMAGTALAVVPVIVMFAILGRHIIGGLMEGALKG
jgi:cellobiose transport system permease protein